MAEKEEDENCEACKLSVGIGMYLNVCRTIGDKEECGKLFDKVVNENISPQELFDIIKEKAKDHPEELETLKYIDELMEKAEKELENEPQDKEEDIHDT